MYLNQVVEKIILQYRQSYEYNNSRYNIPLIIAGLTIKEFAPSIAELFATNTFISL